MIKTFRWRLTLWYLGCFALLFSLLTAGLYGVLSRALIGRLDETLVSQAATAVSLFQDELDESHGDVPVSAHEVVTNMRLTSSKAALVDGARRRIHWRSVLRSRPRPLRNVRGQRPNRRSSSPGCAWPSIA